MYEKRNFHLQNNIDIGVGASTPALGASKQASKPPAKPWGPQARPQELPAGSQGGLQGISIRPEQPLTKLLEVLIERQRRAL